VGSSRGSPAASARAGLHLSRSRRPLRVRGKLIDRGRSAVEQCLSNVLRLETYIKDAERGGDSDLADFFRRAQDASRRGAELGKDLLKQRL
jgi:hypothetical protein